MKKTTLVFVISLIAMLGYIYFGLTHANSVNEKLYEYIGVPFAIFFGISGLVFMIDDTVSIH